MNRAHRQERGIWHHTSRMLSGMILLVSFQIIIVGGVDDAMAQDAVQITVQPNRMRPGV